jgi:hypothetical protein
MAQVNKYIGHKKKGNSYLLMLFGTKFLSNIRIKEHAREDYMHILSNSFLSITMPHCIPGLHCRFLVGKTATESMAAKSPVQCFAAATAATFYFHKIQANVLPLVAALNIGTHSKTQMSD